MSTNCYGFEFEFLYQKRFDLPGIDVLEKKSTLWI